MSEEGVVSLLRRPGPVGGTSSYHLWASVLYDDMEIHLFSLENFQTLIVFFFFFFHDCFHRRLNKLQCLNLVNDVDDSVFELSQFKNKSFSVL